jgi:heme/copper-type cytochrome/quinol oxidase subunit 2
MPLSVLAETPVFRLTLKNHVFIPSTLIIPANVKVKLTIRNEDDLAEEFDSFDLNREKVIFPGRKVTMYIGPLPPGTYLYFGEYHPNSAQGKIVVEHPHDH